MRHTTFRTLVLLLCVGLLFGCTRRPLEDEVGDLAFVPIHIDWSQSGLDVSKMHNASAWFYPQDGRPPIEYRLEANLVDDYVMLPTGVYSVIVFNESIDLTQNEASPLVFSGQNSFDTFSVSTKDDKSAISRFYGTRADVDPKLLRQSPEAIASWSISNFEVTWDMVVITRSRANNIGTRSSRSELSRAQEAQVDKALEALKRITPLPLTHNITVEVYVQQLSSAASVGGRLTGTTGQVLLATRQPMLDIVEHPFEMMITDAVWDEPTPKPGEDPAKMHGTLRKTFLIFHHQATPTYALDFSFLLKDGNKETTPPFDITGQVNTQDDDIKVKVGLRPEDTPDDTDKDRPIILPIPQSNNVGVGKWEEGETIQIK